ncbi:unnamed protein product [Prunus armeniaca]
MVWLASRISRCYPTSRDEQSNRGAKLHSSCTGTFNAMCSSNTKSYAHRLHHYTPEIPMPCVMIPSNIHNLPIRRKFQRRVWEVSHTPESPKPRVRLITTCSSHTPEIPTPRVRSLVTGEGTYIV